MNILVLSNGAWKNINGTPWEGIEKDKTFRHQIPFMKQGKPRQVRKHWFKLVEAK